MNIALWITMVLTGIAGLAFGVRIGDSHRRRLEKALAAKDNVLQELNKKIQEKDKMITEAQRDSRNKAVRSVSAGPAVRKTTAASKKLPKQPQKRQPAKGSEEAVAESSLVYREQDPNKLLSVS